MKTILSIAFLFALASPAAAATCGSNEAWGAPGITDERKVVEICHQGYASAVDSARREAAWVAYDLTAPHTLGCFPRTGLTFKVDKLLDANDQGKASDYAASGYDLGHMAPNEDFAWSKTEQADTFSLANVEPQLPGLNRQGWERLEEDVRGWALTRGDLQVYVGPIYWGAGTIGKDKLPIPSAFFKVVVDRKTGDAIGFVMPQKAIPKGEAQPWLTPIARIEEEAKVTLPLPVKWKESTTAWTADLSGWRSKHKEACTK